MPGTAQEEWSTFWLDRPTGTLRVDLNVQNVFRQNLLMFVRFVRSLDNQVIINIIIIIFLM